MREFVQNKSFEQIKIVEIGMNMPTFGGCGYISPMVVNNIIILKYCRKTKKKKKSHSSMCDRYNSVVSARDLLTLASF